MKKIPYLFLLMLAGIVLYLSFGHAFTIESLQASKLHLESLVKAHPIASPFFYMLIYTLAATLSLPIAAVLTIAGGFLFGTCKGALFAITGATAGATLCFLTIRYLLNNRFHHHYKHRLATFYQEIDTFGFWYLLALRLIAFLPFFVVTILAALTPIQVSTFVAATGLGIIPGTLVYAYAGSSLATIRSISDILSPRIIAVFILLALLALVPVFFRQHRARR